MALDRIVPVANVQRATRAEADVDRNKAQVRRENQIADVLFVVTELVLIPFLDLDPVRRLLTHLDEATLQLVRESGEVDELLAAGARIRAQAGRLRVLLRVRRVERVKR